LKGKENDENFRRRAWLKCTVGRMMVKRKNIAFQLNVFLKHFSYQGYQREGKWLNSILGGG
jgi:hypothetical protein